MSPMYKLLPLAFSLFLAGVNLCAQVNLEYQVPGREILELVDVPRVPLVLMDADERRMVLLKRDAFKPWFVSL